MPASRRLVGLCLSIPLCAGAILTSSGRQRRATISLPDIMALKGIRVVDASTGIAGGLAAMLLADFGAEVVKVEPPGGDPARAEPGFAVWNRNKRSIVLDLAVELDRPRASGLPAGAGRCVLRA